MSIKDSFLQAIAAINLNSYATRLTQEYIDENEVPASYMNGMKHSVATAIVTFYAGGGNAMDAGLANEIAERVRSYPDSSMEMYKDFHNNIVGIVATQWATQKYTDLDKGDIVDIIGYLVKNGIIPMLSDDPIIPQIPGSDLITSVIAIANDRSAIASRVVQFLDPHEAVVDDLIDSQPDEPVDLGLPRYDSYLSLDGLEISADFGGGGPVYEINIIGGSDLTIISEQHSDGSREDRRRARHESNRSLLAVRLRRRAAWLGNACLIGTPSPT